MSDAPAKYKLYSPYRSRERILLCGGPKVGKSEAVRSLAKYIPDATFHIVDNDNAHWAMNERGVYLPNLDIRDVEGYQETYEQIREVRQYVLEDEEERRDDWLVVDLFSVTWDDIQTEFVEEVFDMSMDAYMMSKRKSLQDRRKESNRSSGGALGTFEKDTDWTTINAVYRQLQATLRRFPCNVICCTEVDKIDSSRNEDKEILRLFGPYGVKPRGQKRSPHLFHTILLLAKMGTDQYTITTVGDRAREQLDEDEVGEFAVTYLQGVAKWKVKMLPKKVKVEESEEGEE